jgi:hypothetical protein
VGFVRDPCDPESGLSQTPLTPPRAPTIQPAPKQHRPQTPEVPTFQLVTRQACAERVRRAKELCLNAARAREQARELRGELLRVPLLRDPSCGASARRLLETHLAQHPRPTLQDAKTVLSELVNNAVVHGQGAIQLRLSHCRDWLRIEVTDEGTGAEIRIRDGGPKGGMGLGIVDQLAPPVGRPRRNHPRLGRPSATTSGPRRTAPAAPARSALAARQAPPRDVQMRRPRDPTARAPRDPEGRAPQFAPDCASAHPQPTPQPRRRRGGDGRPHAAFTDRRKHSLTSEAHPPRAGRADSSLRHRRYPPDHP